MIPFTDREGAAVLLIFRSGGRKTAVESKCPLDKADDRLGGEGRVLALRCPSPGNRRAKSCQAQQRENGAISTP